MLLSNKNISLRRMEPSDLDLLYAWENNTENWLISNTVIPFSKYTLNAFIQTAHDDITVSKQLRLMIDTIDKTIGCIDFFDVDFFNSRAGVGILIGNESDRRKGFATEALETALNYAFETLHLNQVYCNVLSDNIDSMQLFKKIGFEIAAFKKQWVKNGEHWKDEYMLQRLRSK